jgi:hypothetical protein
MIFSEYTRLHGNQVNEEKLFQYPNRKKTIDR